MNQEEAFSIIKSALIKTKGHSSFSISLDIHLINDGIIDSLDSMVFVHHLETILGESIEEIDEEFSNFQVGYIIAILLRK
jgi:hypothetical protein